MGDNKNIVPADDLPSNATQTSKIVSSDDLPSDVKKKSFIGESDTSLNASPLFESESTSKNPNQNFYTPPQANLTQSGNGETVEEAKQAGHDVTYQHYLNSAAKLKNTKGAGNIMIQGEKPLEEPIENYVTQHGEQIGEGVKTLGKGLKHGGVEGALDVIKGGANIAFSGLSLTNPYVAGFNVGTEALPEKAQQWLSSPVTKSAELAGYKPKDGSLGEQFLSVADILAPLAVFHGAGELAKKIKTKQLLTPDEIVQSKQIIDNTTTDEFKKVLDENEKVGDQYEDENKVVDVIEKAKEDKNVNKDIAKLDIDKKTFNNVVDVAKQGEHLPEEKANELKKQYDNIQSAKESIPEEHQDNAKVVSLVADKKSLEEKKGTLDKVFHPEIDVQIEGIDNKIKDELGMPKEEKEVATPEKSQQPVGQSEVSPMKKEELPEAEINHDQAREEYVKQKMDESDIHQSNNLELTKQVENYYRNLYDRNNVNKSYKTESNGTRTPERASDENIGKTNQQGKESEGQEVLSEGTDLPNSRESNKINSRNEEVANELKSRISKATGAAKISKGDGEGKDLREIDNKTAYDYAKETNTWIGNLDALGERYTGGNEHTTVVNEGNGKIYKSNNLINTRNLTNFFDKIRLHNELFPDTPYKFEGFAGVENTGSGKPYVEPVYSQDFIKDAKHATTSEIADYMKRNGFEQTDEFKFKKDGIEVSDLRPRNVLKDKNGIIHVVDAEFKKIKSESKLNPESKLISETHPQEDIDFAHKFIDNGMFSSTGEANEQRIDIGLSKEEIYRGIRNIKDGENTQAAKALIEKLNGIRESGDVPFIQGHGGNSVRSSVPLSKINLEEKPPTELPIKEEVKSEEDKSTPLSTKNESIETKAKELGYSEALAEATKTASRDFGSVWDEAQKDIEDKKVNPETLRNNLADGKGIPENMSYDTANAILLHDQIILENTRDKAIEAINQGGLSEDAINDLQVEKVKAENALYNNYLASEKIGTQLGRGLNARRMLANKDYSLSSMQNEMRAQQDGKPLTEEQKKWTEERAKEYEEKAKKWDDFQKGQGGEEAINAIKNYIKKHGKGKTYTQRAKSAADTFRKLKTKPFVFTDENGNVIDVTTHGITWNDAVEAGARIIEGVGEAADKIANAIHTATEKLKEADWYKKLSDKDKKRFGEQLKQHFEELQKESEEHTEGKIKIPHSLIQSLVEGGIDNIDDLTKAVKEEIKGEFPDATDREVRDAITGYGKTINMSKDEINVQIRKIKRIGKLISGLEDVENKKRPLRSGLQRDKVDAEERAMKTELREAMKDLPMDEAETERHYKTALDAQKTRLKNKIEDLQNEIDTKQKATKNVKRTIPDEEIKQLTEKKNELQKQHDEIFKDEAFKQKARLEAYKQRSAKKITELEDRLKKGDFATKAKPSPIEHDKESLKLQSELQDAKDNFQQGKEALRLEQRGWGQKGIDGFLRAYREGLLSRVTTLGKLAMFGLTRQMLIRPLYNIAGQIPRVISKINEIAKKAPTEGGMNLSALAENYKTFVNPESYKQAYKKLGKLGKSDLDRAYGEHQFNYGELPFITTKSHGAIKHVPLQAEMNYAKKALTDWMEKNEKPDFNNPAIQDFINKYSYAKGMDAIYMGESKLLRQYQMNIRMWEQQGGNKYALAKLAKFMFPIIKVPYNFTKDVMIKNTPIGITDAAIKAYKADVSKLTKQEADNIMMGFKKGMVGTSMILLGGYLAQKTFGGLYSKEDKSKNNALKANAVNIGGIDIPHWATHNALVEVAQMGATVANVFQDAPESNGTTPEITEAMAKSIFEAGVAESGNLPFYGELKNINEASGTWSKTKTVAGQKVASIVPGLIQEVANKLDTRDEEGKRQEGYHPFSETRKVSTEGFVNPIKSALPLVRNTMNRPISEIKATEKHGKPMSESKRAKMKLKRDNKFKLAEENVGQE